MAACCAAVTHTLVCRLAGSPWEVCRWECHHPLNARSCMMDALSTVMFLNLYYHLVPLSSVIWRTCHMDSTCSIVTTGCPMLAVSCVGVWSLPSAGAVWHHLRPEHWGECDSANHLGCHSNDASGSRYALACTHKKPVNASCLRSGPLEPCAAHPLTCCKLWSGLSRVLKSEGEEMAT